MPTRKKAFQLVLWYVVLATSWLFIADWLLGLLIHDQYLAEALNVLGDVLFVVLSAVMLAWLQWRYFQDIRRSASQLQENETRLRVLGDNLPESFVYQYTRDAAGKPHFTYVSAGVERMFGLRQEDVVRDASFVFALIDPVQLAAYGAAVAESARSLSDFDMELRVVRPDGTERLIHVRSRPRRDEQGRILWDGLATDITERRRTESERAAVTARYRSLFENMLNGFAHCEVVFEAGKAVDFVYLEVNPIFGALTGLKDVVGKRAAEVIPGVHQADPELLATYARVALTGVPEKFEIYVAALQDWFAISVYSPAPNHFMTVFDVITERKQTEAALKCSEQNYREIFNATNEAIFLHDAATGAVLDVNEAMLRMHGYDTKEEFFSMDFARILGGDSQNSRDLAAGRIRQAFEQGPQVFELLNHRKDGGTFWAEVSLRGSQIGGQGRVLAVVRDITERKRVEEALRLSETKFARAFANNPAAIALTRLADEVVLEVNDTWVALSGFSRADIIGRSARVIWPSEEEAAKFVQALREHGIVRACEQEFRNQSGERFTVQLSAVRMNFDGEEVILSTLIDITDRKRVEAALSASEEEFRAMFETASVGMGQADPQAGTFLRVNAKMCKITGYSRAEMLQLKVPDITHPDDREHDWELFRRVIAGEAPSYQVEKRYIRKDGKIAWVNVNMNIIRDAAGKPLRTMATIEDINQRRKAEEERMRLSTALEQAAESIVITDLTGMILYVNPAFERITGYSRREAIGQNPRILQSGRQDAAFYKQMWGTLVRGEVWRGRFVNKRKDGSLFDEDATISPVRDASGKIVNYMAIKLDVSRQVELEGQIRQTQKLEAIGQLAGGVAHDFNNILTSILMQISLGCMAGSSPADIHDSFDQIRHDAERAASLTRQLLLFSRRQVMQSQDLDVNECMTHLAKMLQRIIGEDVQLQLHLHSTPLMTHADAGMLDQVVMNLAVNARDAMPQGGSLLIATSEKVVDDELASRQPDAIRGRYICLSVTDTGSGIPADILPRIFEPFFTTKETGKGTGLGLATVFGIVKQHRGWITVETAPGRGTTFKVFMPALLSPPVKVQVEARRKPRGGIETLLLAEDEAMVRQSLRTILTRNGYRVLEAANGETALELWKDHQSSVALLLTDLVMPGGVSGQQLARRLQTDNPRLKIIYTSGYSAEIAGQELHLQAGEHYVQKPLNPEELLKIVRLSLDDTASPTNAIG